MRSIWRGRRWGRWEETDRLDGDQDEQSHQASVMEVEEAPRMSSWEFPGGPVVRTQCFHCRGLGSASGWGTKIPQASQRGQKKKKKKKKE